jgi:hypothetical protein
MNRFAPSLTVVAAAATMLLLAHSAHAQRHKSWVSETTGDDANTCSIAFPCWTYQGAYNKTDAGGEIHCLEPGNYSGVTISKSISITCDDTRSNILSFVIRDAPAGTIVTLNGHNIECAGYSGGIGVTNSGGVILHVRNMQIRNCRGGGSGINIAPTSGASEVYVLDSTITDSGHNALTGGIAIRPTGAASVRLHIERTTLENNSSGIILDGTGGTGGIRGVIRDSTVAGTPNTGIAASSGAPVQLMIANVTSQSNGFGLTASGPNTRILVEHTRLVANSFGLSGSTILSYGNNSVELNGTDGAFTGPIAYD